jgi:hypothetical protein
VAAVIFSFDLEPLFTRFFRAQVSAVPLFPTGSGAIGYNGNQISFQSFLASGWALGIYYFVSMSSSTFSSTDFLCNNFDSTEEDPPPQTKRLGISY